MEERHRPLDLAEEGIGGKLQRTDSNTALHPLDSTKETGSDKMLNNSFVKKDEHLFSHTLYTNVFFYTSYWNCFKDVDLASTLRGSSCVCVRYLTRCCCFQIHFVSFNDKYQTIGESLDHSDGLAVLGVFLEVLDNHFLQILLLESQARLRRRSIHSGPYLKEYMIISISFPRSISLNRGRVSPDHMTTEHQVFWLY